ncbi:hypothetical protein CYMTET_53916 [Cymbomonas tetramitiformis]|uniref:Uncharacterized protein n=1 Tax=Cymbomonas tetramitiformis TaxID=36881 RepID=A0AAE0BGA9_9CHLO|nr:hypothetical protein CYMTET_53916 [Cymbomonas tetramitiformis]
MIVYNATGGQAFGAREGVAALNAIAETEAFARAVEEVLPLPPPPPKPKGLNAVGTALLSVFCGQPQPDPPPYRRELPPHEKTGEAEFKWDPEREDKAYMRRLVLAAAGSNDAYEALVWLKELKADWGVTKKIRVASYLEVPGVVAALATALEALLEDVREAKMCSDSYMGMITQQGAEAELSEMAQQQDEAQEEWRALQEMAQQQATAQKEVHQDHTKNSKEGEGRKNANAAGCPDK